MEEFDCGIDLIEVTSQPPHLRQPLPPHPPQVHIGWRLCPLLGG